MNVMFKRGTQAALNDYLAINYAQSSAKDAVEGAFYLTSDTNRLYVGKSVTVGTGDAAQTKIKAVAVNQGVVTVANVAALANVVPEAGQFYYASAENVLCVYSGSTNGWVQINPDTNTHINTRTVSASTQTIGSGAAAVTFPTISDVIQEATSTGSQSNTGASFSFILGLEGKEGLGVTTESYTVGSGANAQTRYRFVLTPTVYSISESVASGTATITVADGTTGGHTSSVKLKGDGTNTTISQEGTDTIVITSKNTTMGTGANASFNASGELSIQFKDSDNKADTAKVTPKVKLGDNTTEYKFVSGTLTLPVYTKTEVDNIKKSFNAMVYRGTVGAGGTYSALASITDISIGDTFKVCQDPTFDTDGHVVQGISAITKRDADGNASETVAPKVGDLLIANGTEDATTGYITAASLFWDYVPSGNDEEKDTQYHMQTIINGSVLYDNSHAAKGGITIAADGTYLTVSDSGTNGVQEVNTVTISHATQTGAGMNAGSTADSSIAENGTAKTQEVYSGSGTEMVVTVPVLTYDAAGHIVSVKKQTYTLKDTHNTASMDHFKATAASATGNNTTTATLTSSATLSVQVKNSDGPTSAATMQFKSSTLNMALDGNNVSINLMWGQF